MKENNLCFLRDGASLTVKLSGDVDHHSAKDIRERIDKEIFHLRPRLLRLDFGNIGFMDSSGIALIFGRVESAAAVGATVRLERLSPALMKLVRLSGAERVRGLSVVG